MEAGKNAAMQTEYQENQINVSNSHFNDITK